MKHLFLPLAITTLIILLTTTANGNNVVYDTIGDPVVAGKEYYIVPYSGADGSGGLAWKENVLTPLAPCPEYYIYQIIDGFNYGQPITFYTIDTKKNEVIVSSNVNIMFPNLTPPKDLPFFCPTVSNVWKVQNKQVSLGGQKGGRDAKSLFTIVDLGRGKYGLNYCDKRSGCGALGVEEGVRRVVVNGGKRLEVVFATESPFLKQVVNVD